MRVSYGFILQFQVTSSSYWEETSQNVWDSNSLHCKGKIRVNIKGEKEYPDWVAEMELNPRSFICQVAALTNFN